MNASQIVSYHVRLARLHHHNMIQAQRLKKPLAGLNKQLRDEHMEMAREVYKLGVVAAASANYEHL